MLFDSFFLAGFECSTLCRADGQRLDLVESTQHARLLRNDYAAVRNLGMRAVREGLRWPLIDRGSGYDWRSTIDIISAASAANVQVIWDLAHFGCPDDVDIWSGGFVTRFERFARHAAQIISDRCAPPHHYCVINEMSYWAWAGGHSAQFYPSAQNRGDELKAQLVRANIAACEAILEVDPFAVFVTAEPLIHVAPWTSDDQARANERDASQFDAVQMVMGRQRPDLGGRERYVNITGVNFYPFNQWFLNGPTIPFGHHEFKPLHRLLIDAQRQCQRPIFISETAAEGSAKPAWLAYVMQEIALAAAENVHVEGVCWYPIIDYPQWTEERVCSAGLFSAAPRHDGSRAIDPLLKRSLAFHQNQIAKNGPAPIGYFSPQAAHG